MSELWGDSLKSISVLKRAFPITDEDMPEKIGYFQPPHCSKVIQLETIQAGIDIG